jgi:hypothetical protein
LFNLKILKMRNFNVVTYLVGLAGLAISVYVAGKA